MDLKKLLAKTGIRKDTAIATLIASVFEGFNGASNEGNRFSVMEEFVTALLPQLERVLVNQEEQKKKLLQIGTALSSEKNLDALLELIVVEAMDLTNSDGGTIYLLSHDERYLHFKIMQNRTKNSKMGGTSGNKISFPPLSMYTNDGQKNDQMVAVHVALNGKTVNMPDVYEAKGFDFKGTRNFDQKNFYRSKSMLVTPLRNYEDEIVGVLQLINALNKNRDIISYTKDNQELIESLASQAAVAINNATLILELDRLQMGIIKVIASAIDEKSPYTGGHIKRVAEITMSLAKALSKSNEDRWKDFSLNENDEKTLQIAAWMHDIGKITTPEYVVDKATKLETIYDRINTVIAKFETLKRDALIDYLKEKTSYIEANGLDGSKELNKLEEKYKNTLLQIDDDLDFLENMNTGGEFVDDNKLTRIKDIADKYEITIRGEAQKILSENEVLNLSIRKGTLTKDERSVIENHVVSTIKMLAKLPWPKKLQSVCEYAGEHHEKIDGKGYPHQLSADELSIQSRILAIADIFEALTAKDRPYKKGKTISEVVRILGFMVKDGEIDGEILDFFIRSGLMKEYVQKELPPSQLGVFKYNDTEYDCRI